MITNKNKKLRTKKNTTLTKEEKIKIKNKKLRAYTYKHG